MENAFFPAKLLLFGEHLLLQGATALAVPASAFGGIWTQASSPTRPALWQQLGGIIGQLSPDLPLDRARLIADHAQGWYFESTIPQGYGLGSSGALCAALYTRYATATTGGQPADLQRILGAIEASFHGRSSGIDPLTIYLNRPVLIQAQNTVHLPDPYTPPAGIRVFLIDSQQPRQTGVLVRWFLEQCVKPDFAAQLRENVFPIHETMVAAWLSGNEATFFESLLTISRWQLQYLSPMLPAQALFLDWWAAELEQEKIRFKICGAGGGGFFMGFTNDPAYLRAAAKTRNLSVLFPFPN